jgi:hypothetical protein
MPVSHARCKPKLTQALNPLKPIPVIVMSSEDEPQRISRSALHAAPDVLLFSSISSCAKFQKKKLAVMYRGALSHDLISNQ